MVDPARLAWGLRRACLAAGVRIYEQYAGDPGQPGRRRAVRLATPYGSVRAATVASAPALSAALLRRLKLTWSRSTTTR